MDKPVYQNVESNLFPKNINTFHDSAGIYFHWHPEIEILYFETGGAVIFCGKDEYDLNKGDLLFVNPNEAHYSGRFKKNTVHHVFHLTDEFFTPSSLGQFAIIQNKITDPLCAEICKNILENYQNKIFGYEIVLASEMYRMLAHIMKNYVTETYAEAQRQLFFEKKIVFNNIIMYIDKHYNDELSTRAIADVFYVSESYIIHTFKKQIGQTPVEYINNLRIKQAKKLLAKGNESITRIANVVGYNDINYFSRVFKKKTGTTPSHYRKALQDKQQ